jgi:polar amino acid transport system substrate-binding protein
MRTSRYLSTAIFALLIAACAGTQSTPTQEVRQALAPTGKLRVGVYPGSPFSMVRDPASGETKGVTVEVGRELAKRLGVPYEQVEFGRIGEVLEAVKAGKVDVTLANATLARAKDFDLSLAIPNGRGQAAEFVRRFAGEIKSEGLVTRAAARAGLLGSKS